MKFLYIVPILAVSAALGASSASPARDRERPAHPPSAPVTPPWLRDQELGDQSYDEVDDDSDPHAGVYATSPDTASGACTYDPGEAPDCASCGEDDDPHAGMYADDPHAGLYVAGDPHTGMSADNPHADGAADGPLAHAFAPPVNAAAPVERSRAPNGKSVAEVFSARNALDQTRVTVRGTVVKLTEGVLGKTYLHLRDGTGTAEAGDDDLTVTTMEAFSLGETVEVEGRLAIEQDVGVGYSYPALLADASRVQR